MQKKGVQFHYGRCGSSSQLPKFTSILCIHIFLIFSMVCQNVSALESEAGSLITRVCEALFGQADTAGLWSNLSMWINHGKIKIYTLNITCSGIVSYHTLHVEVPNLQPKLILSWNLWVNSEKSERFRYLKETYFYVFLHICNGIEHL